MGFWKNIGQGALNTLTGGLVSGGVGAGLGALTAAQAQKNALALIEKQQDAQSQLNKENAQLGFEYGETAADNALQRQTVLNERQNEYNSAEKQVERLKDAGLSVGLLYGGGAGGAGGAGGTGAQGGGAGPMGTGVPNYLEVEAAKQQRKIADAQMTKTVNESKLVQAQEDKIKAETKNIEQETDRSKELTPIEKRLTEEQAVQTFIENVRKDWENKGGRDVNGEYRDLQGEILGRTIRINEGSNFSEKAAAEIAKVVSEVDLNTENKKTIFRKLLIEEMKGESDKVKAEAIKLAAEWTTGEHTNWKTWTDIAKDSVKILSDIISKAN